MRYRFLAYELDQRLGRLTGPEGEVHLRPQAFRVLLFLTEEAPRILSSDELIDRAWDESFVATASVRQTISELRRALGDDAQKPRIVETVHRRGYRMIAPLETLSGPSSEQERRPTETARLIKAAWPGRPWQPSTLLLAFIALIAPPSPDRGYAGSPMPPSVRAKTDQARVLVRENRNGQPDLPQDLRNQNQQAHALLGRAALLGRLGQIEESTAHFESAASLFRTLGDTSAEAGALNRGAFLLHDSGLHAEAAELLKRAVPLNRQARNNRGLAVSLSLLAATQASLGSLPQARNAIDEALALHRATDDHRRKALGFQCLAKVLTAEGQLQKAAASYRKSLTLSHGVGDPVSAASALRGLGVIAGLQGQPEEAHRHLSQAASQFESLGYLPLLLGTQSQMGRDLSASAPADARRIFSDILQRAHGTTLFYYTCLARTGLEKLAAQ